MNKFFRFLTVAVLALCTLSVSSCKDDDDDDNNSVSADIVGTWVYNAAESKFSQEPESDEDGLDTSLDFSEITFNEDGTFSAVDDDERIEGKYSVKGTELTMSYTEDGQTIVIKKGADITPSAEDMGEFGELMNFSAKINESTVVVNGDKMNMKIKATTTIDFGEFGEMLGIEGGKQTIVSISDMVFNKKN